MKKSVSALLTALVASSAFSAGYSAPGYVTEIIPMTGGAFLFSMTVAGTGKASCGAGNSYRWAINTSTQGGRNQMAAVLLAYSTHKVMDVYGTGVCDVWGDTETVLYPHPQG